MIKPITNKLILLYITIITIIHKPKTHGWVQQPYKLLLDKYNISPK